MTNQEAKQEAIKLAYGKYEFSKRAIYLMDGSGRIEYQYSDNNLNLYSELFESDGCGRYRLKELSDIEDNNGWIRIEPDGSNLPDVKDYSIVYKLGRFKEDGSFYSEGRFHPYDFKDAHLHGKWTHYKPITPDKPPVY